MSDEERHSKALEIELISDPEERARQEAKNGLRQFDEVIERINYSLQPERPFKLRPSAILSLHRRALKGSVPSQVCPAPAESKSKEANTSLLELTLWLSFSNECATASTRTGRSLLRFT
jgi:hypothetical protein